MSKCLRCELLIELYQRTPQQPRDYWIMTELFVSMHGPDVCGGEVKKQAILRDSLEKEAARLGCTLAMAGRLHRLEMSIEQLQHKRC